MNDVKWDKEKDLQFISELKNEQMIWNFPFGTRNRNDIQKHAWKRLIKKLTFKASTTELKCRKTYLFKRYYSCIEKKKQKELKNKKYVADWYGFNVMHEYMVNRGVPPSMVHEVVDISSHSEDEPKMKENKKVKLFLPTSADETEMKPTLPDTQLDSKPVNDYISRYFTLVADRARDMFSEKEMKTLMVQVDECIVSLWKLKGSSSTANTSSQSH